MGRSIRKEGAMTTQEYEKEARRIAEECNLPTDKRSVAIFALMLAHGYVLALEEDVKKLRK